MLMYTCTYMYMCGNTAYRAIEPLKITAREIPSPRQPYEHYAKTHTEPPQLSTKTSRTCDENIKRVNNSKCLCISSTVKCKSQGNNERHRRFHCSWYEAIFCGGKSGISATPPHTGTEVHHPITRAFYSHCGTDPLQRSQGQGCTDSERGRKHRHYYWWLDF